MTHIRIDFVARSSFHGTRPNGRQDWPPSPMRLLGALIAGAHAIRDDAERGQALNAVQQLAEVPAPVVHTSEAVELNHPRTYTEKSAPAAAKVTSGTLKAFLDLSHATMSTESRIDKATLGTLLAVPSIVFEVGELSESATACLQQAADGVGYFGRSQDHAIITVSNAEPELAGLTHTYRPYPHFGGESRGWTPRSIEWFDARHEAMMNHPDRVLPADHGAVETIEYRLDRPDHRHRVPARFDDSTAMVPVMFVRGIRQADIPRVLRKALPESADADVIPLVNVNHSPAKCLGFAVRGTTQARLATAQAIRTNVPDLIDVDDVGSRLFDMYASTVPSDVWITATPVRAFGHRLILKQALERGFGLEVEIIDADTRPLDQWQQRLPDLELTDGLSQWFVKFRTLDPIQGPLLVGEQTSRGFGLCVPIPRRSAQR